MYNLLEYSKNYEKTSGSLFNYYRNEPHEAETADANGAINISIRNSKSFDYKTKIVGSLAAGELENISIRNSKSFAYKTKIVGSLAAGELEKDDVEIAIPLKYLGNFWRSLDIPLINCEITLVLSCYKVCVLVGRAHRGLPAPAPALITSPENAIFEITDCKLYVPVVTLSAENDNKLLVQLKSGLEEL